MSFVRIQAACCRERPRGRARCSALAQAAWSTRELTSSFANTWRICVFTVCGDTNSRSAISRLVRPIGYELDRQLSDLVIAAHPVAGLSAVATRRGIPSPRALYLWAKDTRDKSAGTGACLAVPPIVHRRENALARPAPLDCHRVAGLAAPVGVALAVARLRVGATAAAPRRIAPSRREPSPPSGRRTP